MSDAQGPLPITRRVQRACAPGLWSRGVKLAREGAVTLESRSDEEATLRVRAAGRPVAPSVTLVLVPGDEDWDCDCGGRAMPCEHVAAAAIALGQLGETAAPPAESRAGRIVYRFQREDGGLSVARFVSDGTGAESPLPGSLSVLLSAPAQARRLCPEEPDLRADQVLDRRGRGVLPGDKLAALLAILAELPGAEHADGARLLLDDQPVAIRREPLRPRTRVVDEGDDVVLIIEADPGVVTVVANGVVLCRARPDGPADTLRLLAEMELTGARLQALPRRERFPRARLGELAARVLPELSRRLVVQVETTRLPAIARDEKPRVAFQVDRTPEGLTVLPLLVYGDPPCARIDPSPDGQGRLVHLGGPVPVRDPAAEQALRLRLHAELNLLPGRRSHLAGADAARLAERLQRWSAQLGQRDTAALRPRGTLVPRLETRALAAEGGAAPRAQATLTFTLEADGVTHEVAAEAVLAAHRDGLGLVPLGDGFAALPAGFLDRHADKIEALLAARRPDGSVAAHALPELAELCDALEAPRPPALERLRPLAERFEHIPAARLPAALTAELRPYQRAGVDWLCFLRDAGLGGVLADDMGLGKTLQALCALDARAGRRALVVCPTSVVGNWCAEAARFRPDLRVCEYQGPRRALDPGAHLTVTSYALLRQDSAALRAVPWDAVVLDEAQAIKNPDSQTARAAFALQADFRVALSGTPVENRLDELWSLMHFCNPGLLGSRRTFQDGPAAAIAAGDLAAATRLRARIRPFFLRRLKREVAPELPPRTEATLLVQLDEHERAVYDAVRAAARAEVTRLVAGGERPDGARPNLLAALEALLRLRQAACHPALVPGQSATGSSKLTALCEALESAAADGHKALVFSQWTSLLDLIEPALRAAELAFTRLDGATKDRDGAVARFSAPDGPPVMLLSLKAGGTGLNLTAADHVFLCDPWWNPAAEDQAADRAHRIGQDRPVTIYRLVARDTVEERILELQRRKRALAGAVVDGGAAAALTREDLLALLD